MIPPLLARWKKANSQFKYPDINHEERLLAKVNKLWDDAVKVSLGKGKLVEKQIHQLTGQISGYVEL